MSVSFSRTSYQPYWLFLSGILQPLYCVFLLCSPSDDGKEGSNKDDFYNEDDKHLIESIEREFLITQDNFLPGQIVN